MKELAGHLLRVECQRLLGGVQPGCGLRSRLGEAKKQQNEHTILPALGQNMGLG